MKDKMTHSPYLLFEDRARANPEATLLIAPASAGLPYASQGFRYSYGEVFAEAAALSRRFAAAGYGLGSRVALLLENRPEFFTFWLALNAIGVSIVPINPDLRRDELLFQRVRVGGCPPAQHHACQERTQHDVESEGGRDR